MKIVALGLLVALCISCRRERNEGSVREAVLSVGQTVEAINKNGKVRISYVSPLRRKYEWDTEHRTVGLKPRRERFDGKLGIYDPADAWIFNLRKIRLVLDEATRNFDSDERARAALVESSAYMDWVYISGMAARSEPDRRVNRGNPRASAQMGDSYPRATGRTKNRIRC